MLAWMTKKQQPAAAAAAPAKPTAPFIKAAKFGGAKDGYAFKSGALGPGYYLDSSATGSAKAKAKRAAPPAKKEKAGSAMSKSAMSKDALRVRSPPPRSACPRVLGGGGVLLTFRFEPSVRALPAGLCADQRRCVALWRSGCGWRRRRRRRCWRAAGRRLQVGSAHRHAIGGGQRGEGAGQKGRQAARRHPRA